MHLLARRSNEVIEQFLVCGPTMDIGGLGWDSGMWRSVRWVLGRQNVDSGGVYHRENDVQLNFLQPNKASSFVYSRPSTSASIGKLCGSNKSFP